MAKPSNKSRASSQAEFLDAAGESIFQLFTESVKDYALFMLDSDGNIVSWTDGASRIKGYSAKEVIGQHVSKFYTREDVAAGLPQEALDVAAKEGRHLCEGWRVNKDGKKVWAEVLTTALRSPDGTLRGFAKVVRDATHRMNLQASLERAAKVSEAQVRAILEVAVDAIITIDRRGHIGVFNKAAQEMFGYRPEEVVGKNIAMLMPQPYRSEHDGYMHNYMKTGRKKIIGIGREVAALKKDGTIFPIDLAVSEVRIGNDVTFTG
ncbi:MAG TPA: PAS domain S-box protein, partial [Phycisphaerae bacterium]|nr:PAS domain S-box protein [Phycisphaerae bacterium]